MKIPKIHYVGIVVATLLICALEYYKKTEINWAETLSSRDKIPFGTSILYNIAEKGAWENNIRRSNTTFYEQFQNDSTKGNNALYLAQNLQFDLESTKALLQSVEKGNRALLISSNISNILLDSLQIETKTVSLDKKCLFELENEIRFTDTIQNHNPLQQTTYLAWNDSATNIQLLGTENNLANFVCVNRGKGQVYIHTNPYPFTNYYLLKGLSFEYVNSILSNLSPAKVTWDDYMNNGHLKSGSVLRIVLLSTPLKVAFYLLTLLLLLYLGLEWRRKERMIPIFELPRNNSIEFIGALTNLFLADKNHGTIASYRIKSFQRRMNRKHFIHWNRSKSQVKEQLLTKCHASEADIDRILHIVYTKDLKKISHEDLLTINNTLDDFNA